MILTTITGCGLIEETFLNEPSESNKSQKEIDNQSIAVDSSVEVLTPEEEQQIKEKEEHQKMLDELPDVSVSDWNLLLVNNSQLIDPNLDLPLTVLPNGYLIDERIKQEYENWLKKASEAGFEIVLVSSYRSIDLQQKNYDSSIQRYIDQNYTQEEAIQETENYIAIPRGSEHHTGLAVDIVDSDWLETGKGLIPEYDAQASQHWLVDNMTDYGFILRFPQGKEAETGINYESWHFRYVGIENAKYIEKYDLSLEEYIQLLKEAGK
ncbi:D-alanyl-D-alanine carboxypeptidase [Carnobacterium iners]|uniref:D-alanyl-D-alanine carboxypeptidase n=1 Tax=Carnobacterium iners TaxID=1073423 RepID=A0A1X7N6V8_9LACT|nr:D-alanyl-D-alanine carboxypeptidase [Carnobacterium iners]SMH33236.1 D-alanyl-D-alanine carboxypeptidase [Carnobacterium iners]